jgi:hypothetical protein
VVVLVVPVLGPSLHPRSPTQHPLDGLGDLPAVSDGVSVDAGRNRDIRMSQSPAQVRQSDTSQQAQGRRTVPECMEVQSGDTSRLAQSLHGSTHPVG